MSWACSPPGFLTPLPTPFSHIHKNPKAPIRGRRFYLLSGSVVSWWFMTHRPRNVGVCLSVRVFDSVLRNDDLTVPSGIKSPNASRLLCSFVVQWDGVVTVLLWYADLSPASNQSSSPPPPTGVAAYLLQRATDDIPPRPSGVFYLRAVRAAGHSKHASPVDPTAARGARSHKYTDAVRGAPPLST